MGIGDWGLGIGPNPQSPSPNIKNIISISDINNNINNSFIINISFKLYKYN